MTTRTLKLLAAARRRRYPLSHAYVALKALRIGEIEGAAVLVPALPAP